MLNYYEFFAGGGMARLGLGSEWSCTFANDFDAKKAASYQRQFGGCAMRVGDIAAQDADSLPGQATLAWASFPCQDLSLAGKGEGLNGARSGTFWAFWKLMDDLRSRERAPQMIALENVCGAMTSRGGRDFSQLMGALTGLGYRVGAMVLDAAHFLPQSRPRLFVVAVRPDAVLPEEATRSDPSAIWHPGAWLKPSSCCHDQSSHSGFGGICRHHLNGRFHSLIWWRANLKVLIGTATSKPRHYWRRCPPLT
jgi:DNA (cytosine-5)-methyltransferase 1